MAEERYHRRLNSEQEFQSKIKMAVNRRNQLKCSMTKKATVLHALRIRKIIADAIHNFYKTPKKFNRGDADDYGDDVGATMSVGN